MKKRTKRNRVRPQWVTFPRCFLLTMGMFFAGVSAFGFHEMAGELEAPPRWLPFVMLGMLMLGIVLLAVPFFGSRRDAESWMDTTSRNDASIIVMVIAAPLYLVLKLLFSRPGK